MIGKFNHMLEQFQEESAIIGQEIMIFDLFGNSKITREKIMHRLVLIKRIHNGLINFEIRRLPFI